MVICRFNSDEFDFREGGKGPSKPEEWEAGDYIEVFANGR
jgi:hypothetical protein